MQVLCRTRCANSSIVRARVAPVGRLHKVCVRAASSDASNFTQNAAKKTNELVNSLQSAIGNIDVKIPSIKTDISSLVRYNFVAQVVLTLSAWAVVFFSTHAGLAQGHNINVPTVLLILGVVLSGVSAFLSFGYFRKVESTGLEVFEGMRAMDNAFDHMKINFAGMALTLIAMQAEIGTLFVSTMTSSAGGNYGSIAAMAQAGANLLLVHAVSLLFLTMIIRKISFTTRSLVEWSENMRAGLLGAMPKVG